jgi:hypothetical protein
VDIHELLKWQGLPGRPIVLSDHGQRVPDAWYVAQLGVPEPDPFTISARFTEGWDDWLLMEDLDEGVQVVLDADDNGEFLWISRPPYSIIPFVSKSQPFQVGMQTADDCHRIVFPRVSYVSSRGRKSMGLRLRVSYESDAGHHFTVVIAGNRDIGQAREDHDG